MPETSENITPPEKRDLADLVEGEIVGVAWRLQSNTYKTQWVYEEFINGRYSFIFQSEKNPSLICNLKSRGEHLEFDEVHGIILSEADKERNFDPCFPSSPDYEVRQGMLIEAELWY